MKSIIFVLLSSILCLKVVHSTPNQIISSLQQHVGANNLREIINNQQNDFHRDSVTDEEWNEIIEKFSKNSIKDDRENYVDDNEDIDSVMKRFAELDDKNNNDSTQTEISNEAETSHTHVEEDRENDCAICLESVEKDEIRLSCGHKFHQTCISGWVKTPVSFLTLI